MHRTRKFALAATVAAAAMVALASPAWAHVTVTAPGATSGGSDQEITFRVPVEKKLATVAVTVQLPTNTPIASVLVRPMPGWTHTEKTAKLAKPITTDDGDITTAVSQITWTAARAQGLEPGEFGEFTIIAGQLPTASSLTFKALQTYSDGSVVRWIETAAPGSTVEPDHPAPVLSLSPAGSKSASATSVNGTASSTGSSDAAPVALSIIALVLAAGALGLAVVTRARRSA